MSRESVEKLIDLWINDQSFRSNLRKDPEAAVRSKGFDLDEEEWITLKKIDWNLSDQELSSQISKAL